jgi:hypothetical protein
MEFAIVENDSKLIFVELQIKSRYVEEGKLNF